MTPQEAWSEHKPNTVHLRVFACFYIHTYSLTQKKVGWQTEKDVSSWDIGSSQRYKLYNLLTGKLIGNRDVTFNEKAMFDWSQKEKEESNN